MKTLIVTGGTVDAAFAVSYIQQELFDYFIASDAGIHFFAETGLKPYEILGDFDSADEKELSQFQNDSSIIFHKYQPEKDATDTELALRLAIEKGSSEIHILGASGTRLDHVFGAVHLLGIALECGVPCYLADLHNRIRLVQARTVLKREEQYGTYVSLIPLTTQAEGVTLKGFKYPLDNHTLQSFTTLGISNEIVEEEAVIEIVEGIIIVVESKD